MIDAHLDKEAQPVLKQETQSRISAQLAKRLSPCSKHN